MYVGIVWNDDGDEGDDDEKDVVWVDLCDTTEFARDRWVYDWATRVDDNDDDTRDMSLFVDVIGIPTEATKDDICG